MLSPFNGLFMFGRKKIDINMIVPTSKMSLKASCIRACDNDIDKAMKLYEFFAKDMKDLPDFDIPKPTAFEQVKSVAGEIFGWLDQNQDKLANAYNFIQSVRNGGPISIPTGPPPADVPPIPNNV